MHRPGLKPLDWAAAALSLAAFVLSLALTAAGGGREAVVVIEGPGRSWVYPLEAEVDVDVPGPLGVTHVHVGGGSAWVSDSPCTAKICVATGRVQRPGSWIACLPNRVFVRIEGRQNAEVDKVAF
ncbi:MAG: NusG domain II-containing protein [Thermoleophilia bacterium]|nr:NusG domain II-containing protein [Thermoleophilia bacterium]